MEKIRLIIVDNKQIVCDGIKAMLSGINDIEVADNTPDISTLTLKLKSALAHIALINIYNHNDFDINSIKTLNSEFPKLKILILSMFTMDQFVLQTMKAGANGYLTKDTDRNELLEAIYSLRGGYDYYSKSISNILLKKYIQDIDSKNETLEQKNILTTREIEVLKLFGNGYTNKEIADKLFISIRTVESHKNHIMQKLNMKTTVDLVKFAIKNNIIEF